MTTIIPPEAEKYDLDGIGSATALVLIALLAGNPSTTFLSVGLVGKIVYFISTKFFSMLASTGLVFLNVGAEQIATAIAKSGFDGTLNNAYTLVDQLSANGHGLTPDQMTTIDAPVIAQFEKFAKLTRTKS